MVKYIYINNIYIYIYIYIYVKYIYIYEIYIYIYISKICLSKCLYVYLIYLNDTVLNVSDVKDLTVWR